MGVIDLSWHSTDIPEYTTGRLRYNPFNMLKRYFFGFMTSGYCPRENRKTTAKSISDSCISMDHHTHHTEPGYFINEVLQDKIENIFTTSIKQSSTRSMWICKHIYIDGSKFEAKRQQIYIAVVMNHYRSDMTVSFLDEALQTNVWYPQLHCVRKFL